MEGLVAFGFLSLGPLALGKGNCHVIRTLRLPNGQVQALRNGGLLPTATRVSHPGGKSPSPSQDFR